MSNTTATPHKSIFVLFSLAIVFSSIFILININYYKQKKIARLYRCQPESLSIPKMAAIADNKRILLFGDSRIQRWGEPDLGKDIDVINMGIAGITTGEALCKTNNAILNLKPDWFIVQLGINDLVTASMMSKDLRLKTEAKTLNNLKYIVRKLTSTSSHVLVLTVVPPISPDIIRRLIWGEGIDEAAEKLSDALMNEFPDTVKVYNMGKIFFDSNKNIWKKNFSKNALHWNKEAYDALNTEIKKIISE